jgi:hypothetical protein
VYLAGIRGVPATVLEAAAAFAGWSRAAIRRDLGITPGVTTERTRCLGAAPYTGGDPGIMHAGGSKPGRLPRHGQNGQSMIEGRLSVLFRDRGMKRCLAEGRERFELLVGAAILANNLLTIASLLKRRSSCGRRPA